MARFTMIAIDCLELHSSDLREEAAHHDPSGLEAYRVVIDGQAEWAEVLYCGVLDLAGVAWGADASWLEHIGSAEEACQQEFGDI